MTEILNKDKVRCYFIFSLWG